MDICLTIGIKRIWEYIPIPIPRMLIKFTTNTVLYRPGHIYGALLFGQKFIPNVSVCKIIVTHEEYEKINQIQNPE